MCWCYVDLGKLKVSDKAKIREFYLAKRREIQNALNLSDKVSGNCADFLTSHSNGRTWASYRSFGHEVDLSHFNLKNNFAYPKVVSSGDCMEFYRASLASDEWVRTEFGFLEPKNGVNRTDVESLEGIFFPGVAYDYFGNRIGYGKGHYDKTLKSYTGIKVGVCFSIQVSKELFKCATKDDVCVDYIMTEKGCFEARKSPH